MLFTKQVLSWLVGSCLVTACRLEVSQVQTLRTQADMVLACCQGRVLFNLWDRVGTGERKETLLKG